MMDAETLDLRTRLLELALKHVDAKWDAKLDGRSRDVEYHDRQYRQAKQAFNSLGGEA